MDLPVQITDKALKEIADIKENKKIPTDYGLRIGMKGSGCAGSMIVGFDKKSEHDQVYELPNKVDLYIDKRHLMYLIGVNLDFYEGADARGFTLDK